MMLAGAEDVGAGGRSEFVVLKVADLGAIEGALRVDGFDFESPAAEGEDVHAAVGMAFEELFNGGGAARAENTIPAGEDHAEFALQCETLVDHLAIAVFKDVQRQGSVGKENQLQRKQWQQALRHLCIMAHTAWTPYWGRTMI